MPFSLRCVQYIMVTSIVYFGSTENAGPENGGPKKDERTENAGLKMKDQLSGVENAGPENAGPNVMGGKCRT